MLAGAFVGVFFGLAFGRALKGKRLDSVFVPEVDYEGTRPRRMGDR
jgi:hypothetical protein